MDVVWSASAHETHEYDSAAELLKFDKVYIYDEIKKTITTVFTVQIFLEKYLCTLAVPTASRLSLTNPDCIFEDQLMLVIGPSIK